MRWHLKWQIQRVIYYFHFEAISWNKSRREPRISGVAKYILHADCHGSNEEGTNANKLYKNINKDFIVKWDKSCLDLILAIVLPNLCFSHVIIVYIKMMLCLLILSAPFIFNLKCRYFALLICRSVFLGDIGISINSVLTEFKCVCIICKHWHTHTHNSGI